MATSEQETGLAVRQGDGALVHVKSRAHAFTAVEIRAQVQRIQEVMKAVMQKDVHYGIIPGCDKPSLYKPGAEKLLVTFRIGSTPIVKDLSDDDVIRYRVEAKGFSIHDQNYLGSGIGECSSNEDKYAWRASVCDAEWNETPEDRRRNKWKRGKGGSTYQVKQVRTNPADVANTILKMAKKRAQVDLTLQVTAASDIFTQDLEDMPDEMRDAVADQNKNAKPPITQPQPKQGSQPKQQTEELPRGKTWWCTLYNEKQYIHTNKKDAVIGHDYLIEAGFRFNEQKGSYTALHTKDLQEMFEQQEAALDSGGQG